MAVSPEEEESVEEEEVLKAVGASEEGERIKAKKEGRVKMLTDPRKPTPTEVEEHNRTHFLILELVSVLCPGEG